MGTSQPSQPSVSLGWGTSQPSVSLGDKWVPVNPMGTSQPSVWVNPG